MQDHERDHHAGHQQHGEDEDGRDERAGRDPGPSGGATLGAASAVVGLLAANAIGKRKSGEDVRGDVGLFVILVLYSLVVGFFSFGWLTMIGGILVGALAGVVLAYAPRNNRTVAQVVGLLAVVVACVVAVALPTFLSL